MYLGYHTLVVCLSVHHLVCSLRVLSQITTVIEVVFVLGTILQLNASLVKLPLLFEKFISKQADTKSIASSEYLRGKKQNTHILHVLHVLFKRSHAKWAQQFHIELYLGKY